MSKIVLQKMVKSDWEQESEGDLKPMINQAVQYLKEMKSVLERVKNFLQNKLEEYDHFSEIYPDEEISNKLDVELTLQEIEDEDFISIRDQLDVLEVIGLVD